MGFTIKEIQQLLVLRNDSVSTECNDATVMLMNQKIMKLEEKVQFYQHALKVTYIFRKIISLLDLSSGSLIYVWIEP
ncbi:MerR family DNA-binding protein [Paenibacillus woosongensis]|uniref:MerR family DNA-binding protein n=1 Tax=Paenibacillus woosongensis TaxID=307580 RepID=A0AA95L0Z3_9BACL|nr:MerR family DNA-binding protein [Paenibacillus woosongensis]WHX49059.1 MerR family DNA-binding protein [Paenibacillus woosongensis]